MKTEKNMKGWKKISEGKQVPWVSVASMKCFMYSMCNLCFAWLQETFPFRNSEVVVKCLRQLQKITFFICLNKYKSCRNGHIISSVLDGHNTVWLHTYSAKLFFTV